MQERTHGMDALRILTMFMVVILHILTGGGLLGEVSRFTSQYEAGWFLQCAALCAVDVFALISGYVWVNAKYRYRNILELWLQVLFYTVSITALFQIFAPSAVSALEWLKALFPIMFNQYWYFSSYTALFLFIPLLNCILTQMEKGQLKLCLGCILFLFSCMQTLFFSDAFGTNDGYSAIWLMILYLLGGYIKRCERCKRSSTVWFTLGGYFLCVTVTWLSKLMIELLTLGVLGEVRAGNYLISYKSPTILMASICLLLFFERIRIVPTLQRVIKQLSSLAFGVYLIHHHPLVVKWLCMGKFAGFAHFPWPLEILAVLAAAIVISAICCAIDFARQKLFQTLHIRQKLDQLESCFLNRVCERQQSAYRMDI